MTAYAPTGFRRRALASSPRRCSAVLRPAGEGAAGGDRESRFAAWLEALDALVGARLGLWIVEDVHWAGADLLAFLAFAGDAPGRRLVVATSRPSLLDTAPDWCAGADAAASSKRCRRQRRRISSARSIGDALPDELVVRIAERSDGNPLFIEELLRTWISVGTLVPRGRRLETRASRRGRSAAADRAGDLRRAARRPAAERAGRCPPRVGRGQAFRRRCARELEISGAEEGVELLARRALVAGPSADASFGPSYAYRHALLRDAGYASLARAERARLHVKLAAWLEGAAGASSRSVAEPIARHYARALESVPALAREVAPGLGRDECRALAAHVVRARGRGGARARRARRCARAAPAARSS